MQRITISVDETLATSLDSMAREKGYSSRSEAVRDLVRGGLEQWHSEAHAGEHCVANLSYVVEHRVRALPQRLAEMQHAHHDLVAARTTVVLDHYHSLESVILKGPTHAVRAFADAVRSERGVRFGAINLLRVQPDDSHDHADDHVHHGHNHLSPTL
ncbi:nickel-responsive transcriptional regulator NikR [Novosphingobium sp. MD-1]|jgi:CopG family nickel-responsive transcriptional regulator|uniref:nickel-responsive transcriptional regulator NikR n=1 Tax=Novosphingobium sp. MD-1 TaxID=1630648 RepID=UPI00061B9162|nr:nickel-responsive transcriptional regulator NikR [Novosphingobium sp. MD-1]GAO56348.1 nickel responsive regulator nikR [Novosphingobium sp. MD-1]